MSEAVLGGDSVTSNQTIVQLLKSHVLADSEEVVRVREWSDGVALTTSRRHFVAGSEAAHWLICEQAWVDDIIVAVRDDLLVDGEPEKFALLLLTDGSSVYLNDVVALAHLGRRLADDLDPRAYAQLLVAFSSYSSAVRAVISEPDGLRNAFNDDDLPEAEPVRLQPSDPGLMLTFSSYAMYVRRGAVPMLDVLQWTVDVPRNGPVKWSCRPVLTALPIRSRANVAAHAPRADDAISPVGMVLDEPPPRGLRHGPAAPGTVPES